MAARPSPSHVRTLRGGVRQTELRPYDALTYDDRLGRAVADRTITTGWQRGDHPVLELLGISIFRDPATGGLCALAIFRVKTIEPNRWGADPCLYRVAEEIFCLLIDITEPSAV